MLAVSNDEMDGAESAKAGDHILCPTCHNPHVLKDSEPPMLLFYNCGDKVMMAAIKGKLITKFNLKKVLE